MKVKLTQLVSILVMVMVLALGVFPVVISAEGEHNPIDVAKLTAFLNQTDDEGISNGEKFFSEYGSVWDGSYDIGFAGFTDDNEISGYVFSYNYGFLDPELGIYVDVIVEPDFYGYLDLSGTTSHAMVSSEYVPTHIEGINMSDCANLTKLIFSQPLCREMLATGCESLEVVQALESDYRHICVQPMGYEAPIDLYAVGSGRVELDFNSDPDNYFAQMETFCRINAVADEGEFLGWFDASGNLISSEETYEVDLYQPIEAYAWFAGDVNDDAAISTADALNILRSSLGIGQMHCPDILADVDGDGVISSSDALIVLRFALGV